MSEKASEKSEMCTVEFCQRALKSEIAPPSIGSVGERIRYASRRLGWKYSRTKDAWYGDERISISPRELFRIEEISGLEYARQEVRKHDEAIARATAILGDENPRLVGEIVAAVLKAIGISDRAGNS